MLPKLVAEYLMRLHARKEIRNVWQVRVTYAAEDLETGFSIQPDTNQDKGLCLQSMQQDVMLIADSLVAGVRGIALEYIDRCEANLPRQGASRICRGPHFTS